MKCNAVVVVAVALLVPARFSQAEEETRAPVRPPDVHFVATPHEVVEIMLRLADVTEDDLVYDLGCGDGRIVIAAAKKAGCRAIGFDIDPQMVAKSRKNVKDANVEHLVTIKEADMFKLDLSDATVITLYLLPSLNVRLIPQLENLRPGSRIVSHDFDMEGVRPDVEATVFFGDGEPHERRKVYLWTTPLKKIESNPESNVSGVNVEDLVTVTKAGKFDDAPSARELECPERDPDAAFTYESE